MHIKGGGVEVVTVVLLIKGARSLPGTSLAALEESHPYPYGGLLGCSGVDEAEALDLMLPLLARMREC